MKFYKIRLHAETHDPAGKRRSWSRTLDSHCRTMDAMWTRFERTDENTARYIENHLPAMYYGCEVTISTPTGTRSGIVDPDSRKFSFSEVSDTK